MSVIWFSKLDSDVKDQDEQPFEPIKNGNITLFGKPKEVGYFSIDRDRKIYLDRSQMKYLTIPYKNHGLHLDLNVNFNIDIFHVYVTIEKMYQTLFWLMSHCGTVQQCNFNEMSNIDFITVRGTLVLIACAPYLKGFYKDQWEICATKFRGIIYFSAIDSDDDLAEIKNATLKQLLSQSWGYKFEQYMTTDTVNGMPDLASKTHQLEEFCIVLKNILGKHSLMYKAEIDAVIPHRFPGPGSGDTCCYTELKTTRIINTANQKYAFQRYKMVTWWAQSYFAGIPEIITGLRDANGIVKSLEIHRVSTLPNQAQGLWSPDVCLNFCDTFLKFLKKTVTDDDHNIVYNFRYKAGDMIYCKKLVNPEQKFRVIPKWYAEKKDF